MLLHSMAAAILVVLAMLLAIRMVRVAANLVVALLCGGGCGYAIFNIVNQVWLGWAQVVVNSLATGVVVALFSLPVLPFSRFSKD